MGGDCEVLIERSLFRLIWCDLAAVCKSNDGVVRKRSERWLEKLYALSFFH